MKLDEMLLGFGNIYAQSQEAITLSGVNQFQKDILACGNSPEQKPTWFGG